ncbi:MAG: restriction endonuclease subunit S [Clostridia bacterium]|nr:restriction endonuclease subunit S [Clostridia bacterium]
MKALQKFTNAGIPKDWTPLRLKTVCNFNYGIPLSDSNRVDGPYPVYGSNGIVGWHNSYFVTGPGIVVGRKGTAGEVSWVFDNFTPIDTTFYITLKDQTNNMKYVYYLLQICGFEKFSGATGVPGLNRNDAYKLIIPMPKETEQKAIAEILSKVDQAIEVVKKSIKVADKLKKSLMQNILTGKLKPDGSWRSEEEFYVDEKFGKIPKGWHIVKGNKITSKITKGQSPKWKGFEYQPSGILFVTSENVRDGYIDVSEPKFLPVEFHEKIKNSQLQNGDVLINIVGASIGRCAVYDLNIELANTNQAVCVLRINDDNDSKFISYYLQSEKTQRRLLGSQVETARANLSLSDFRKFKFIIPETKHEQLLIAEEIEKVNSLIVSKQTKIHSLRILKKSLMQNLLTGKVRVNVEEINQLLEEV